MPGQRKTTRGKEAKKAAPTPRSMADALQDYAAAGAFAEMGLFDEARSYAAGEPERRKILVVSTEPEFDPSLMEQALSLSGRLGSELVAVIVDPDQSEDSPAGPSQEGARAKAGGLKSSRFAAHAASSLREFERMARDRRIPFQRLLRFGRPSEIIERACMELRRVEFVLTSKKHKERHALSVGMAMFAVGN